MIQSCKALLKEEELLKFSNFSNEDALKLGLLAIDISKNELEKSVVVHIELDAHTLFSHYMTGTTEENTYWVNVKKNTVKKFNHSSLYMGNMYKEKGTNFQQATGLDEDEFRGEGGSFPIIVMDIGRVGTMTVSGMTGEEDHALVVESIRRFLEK